jgi:amino acid transporter
MLLAIAFNTIGSFVCLNLSMGTLLRDGGPAMMIYGWIIGTIFNGIIVYLLADMCEKDPVAGGVYTWSGIYSSYKWCPLISFICGWSNFLGIVSQVSLYA